MSKQILEINRLAEMLEDAGIPFERADDLVPEPFSIRRIQYPRRLKYVFSVIQGYCTYGNEYNLLELRDKAKSPYEDPEGYLSAEEVFERIKKHYEGSKCNGQEKSDRKN